jgi:hypothetical protein
MLYEGNPDSTNIQERFRYKFEVPAPPATEEPADIEVNGTGEKMDETTGTEGVVAAQAITTEQQTANGDQAVNPIGEQPVTSAPSETPAQDTEMGGTS